MKIARAYRARLFQKRASHLRKNDQFDADVYLKLKFVKNMDQNIFVVGDFSYLSVKCTYDSFFKCFKARI